MTVCESVEKNPARTKLIAETYKYEDFEFILQLSKTINPLTAPVIREILLCAFKKPITPPRINITPYIKLTSLLNLSISFPPINDQKIL